MAGSVGRLCSSIKERGACLTCVALLFRCFVGTARALFRFGAVNILLFFLGGGGGRSKDQRCEPCGSDEPKVLFVDVNIGLMPPIFRSYEAYRCFAVGLSRGRRISRRSGTKLTLFLARSELIPSRASFSFSASSSTSLCTRSRRSQYTSYQQSDCSGISYSSHLGISRFINSNQSSLSSSIR